MSDFDLGMDLEAELAGIRGHKDKKEKPDAHQKNVKQEQTQSHRGDSSQTNTGKSKQAPPTEPDGFDVKQSHQETPGNDNNKKKKPDPINWKQFKTLPGIFEHVGGDRPVRLNQRIRKSQVSGIPEPFLGIIQEQLKERFIGAVVDFPWGSYQVTDKNRVFNANPSLMRYLLFDSLRDDKGTHVQYAKQWMVLQHPVFDEGFNPDAHLGVTNDELDIYALLFIGHSAENQQEDGQPIKASKESEHDHQTAERIGLLNMSMSRVLDKLSEQEEAFATYTERNTTLQTVMLLDRMGLLKGGLPKDVGDFVRILEESRGVLAETDDVITHHMEAEKERQKTLARQQRMRKMQGQS